MSIYPKIDSVYLRDPENHHKTFLEGRWSRPEFGYLASLDWLWTEKIDGMNIRIEWMPGLSPVVTIKGRTDNANLPPFLLAVLHENFRPDLFAPIFPDGAVLYGEGYGPKIQKGGGDYRDDPGFILFDVLVGSSKNIWLEWDNVMDVGDKLHIPVAPLVCCGPLAAAIDLAENGFASEASVRPRDAEGLVLRPEKTLFDRMGRRIITKVKYKDFSR